MTTYDYNNLIARSKKQIEKYGGTVYLKIPVDGDVDAGSGQITYNDVIIPVKGVVTGFSSAEVNNINVLENDKRVVIATEHGKPLVNNLIVINDEEHRILEVNEVNPGVDNPVIYRLHVRSTTLSEDFDTFVTTLKGLAPGDIITDPSNPRDYPNWIKLVSDYPEQDVTMLLEQYPYESAEFSLDAPTLNRWTDTELYDYLIGTYIFRYSSDFYDLLQEVGVISRDYTVQSKIAVPSAEEMTGFTIGSENSGKQIPYFEDKQFRRIAIDKDEFVNVSWWTRDYYGSGAANALGIGQDGNLYSYLISNTLAIRACVYINNNQRVILNDDGETYNLIYS
jgi:hypothetical protein